jgi:hypothetical protein
MATERIHGVPTGKFGPGNLVTQAVILKMALFDSGKKIGAGTPQNVFAQEN